MAGYSGLLNPREIAECLRASAGILQAELTALPALVLSWHPAPGEWCINETLGHLIEAEPRGFAGRIQTILSVDNPQFSTWDQVGMAHERRDCDRDPAGLLDEFRGMREASIALVAGLQEGDLARGGYHPTAGYLRVADLLHEWVYHDRNHIRQILANVQSAVWPFLGNSKRFYEM